MQTNMQSMQPCSIFSGSEWLPHTFCALITYVHSFQILLKILPLSTQERHNLVGRLWRTVAVKFSMHNGAYFLMTNSLTPTYTVLLSAAMTGLCVAFTPESLFIPAITQKSK